jgi:hypothetical protein
VLAQQSGTQPKQEAQTPAPPAAESPAPVEESRFTGWVELGYRWRTDVAGSFDTYRSIVNLGSGPKLFAAEFSVIDPQKRVFDRVDVRAYSWGGEPYTTFHLQARKSRYYDFTADYRNIAYFNALPSFADPLLSRGIILSERSFDTRRRFGAFDLELRPGARLRPYFSYSRDAGAGNGVTTFVSDADEFPVPDRLRDSTNLYRGGLRLELNRLHVTVEQGGTTFKDDQSLYQRPGAINPGNQITPFLNNNIGLSGLVAAYGIGGHSIYSKGLLTASPARWLDLYGQFLFSQPQSNVNYQQTASGSLVLQSQLLFYTGQQFLATSSAKLPHTTGQAGGEIRPVRRVRITALWVTDRLHDAGSASSNQTLMTAAGSAQITALLASTLARHYSYTEANVFFDVTPRLTLRGGYRYEWGQGTDLISPAAGLTGLERGHLRRNTGLGGITWKPAAKLSASAETEVASSGAVYFRTSLSDYQRVRGQVRYQPLPSLSAAVDLSFLTNDNPAGGNGYEFHARQGSVSLSWAPQANKMIDFEASYGRASIKSNIYYLAPQNLLPELSAYHERANIATALMNATIRPVHNARLTAGGSFIRSSGSRGTRFYEPLVRASVPLMNNVTWFSEWRYYGYAEPFYVYEAFRAHLVSTGLRIGR